VIAAAVEGLGAARRLVGMSVTFFSAIVGVGTAILRDVTKRFEEIKRLRNEVDAMRKGARAW
jgi:HAMP domain-containing protein